MTGGREVPAGGGNGGIVGPFSPRPYGFPEDGAKGPRRAPAKAPRGPLPTPSRCARAARLG
ncbi:hypothetical protein NH44784_029211 [Achromobacter xylosoxidans NH44784-1996]|nr:hypothetical protein NH44784_029211 [Achromobacter xylosoxidans NH44784-1996]